MKYLYSQSYECLLADGRFVSHSYHTLDSPSRFRALIIFSLLELSCFVKKCQQHSQVSRYQRWEHNLCKAIWDIAGSFSSYDTRFCESFKPWLEASAAMWEQNQALTYTDKKNSQITHYAWRLPQSSHPQSHTHAHARTHTHTHTHTHAHTRTRTHARTHTHTHTHSLSEEYEHF